jgi:hypothetical protein
LGTWLVVRISHAWSCTTQPARLVADADKGIPTGLPNVAFFPYDTLEAQIAKPDRWTPTPNGPGPEAMGKNGHNTPSEPMASSHITVPKITDEADLSKKIDLYTALQYGQAVGYLPLASFIRQFSRDHLHPNVPYVGGQKPSPLLVRRMASTRLSK